MGRGKVILKRIEDKSNRQVSFSKRRNGFLKKSHELAVMCDVDIAAFVFSSTGRLHEFSAGESMTNILTRYQSFKKTEELVRASVQEKLASEYRDVCTGNELNETIQGHLEENDIQMLDITGLDHAEQQLGSFLQQVRIRKTQLNLEALKALQDKEMELQKERNRLMQEIKAATVNEINDDSSDAEPPQLPVMNVQVIW